MIYRETSTGVFMRWNGERLSDGRLINPRDAERWSDQELAAVDLYKPGEADPVPEGKLVVSTSVQRIEGVVKFVHELADAPEPEPVPSTPVLYAAAQLQIVDYDITGIEINSKLGGAFWADTGKYGVFFAETQPDTSYMIQASAGPCSAYVLPSDKLVDFFTVTVTDAAGQPTEAEYVNLSIVRAI